MILDSEAKLLDLNDWVIQPIISTTGAPVTDPLHDAEALARAPDGSFMVGFEKFHRIWRYPPPPPNFPFFARTGFHPGGSPKSAKQRRTGRHCHFFGWSATGFDRGVPEPGWKLQRLVDRGERFFELSYLPSEEFRVTDCAALSNGDVIVLERRYVPFGILSARLKLVRGETVQPGAKLVGEELLKLEYPLNVDNFEGVAVQEDPTNGTIIYIVSDDNYNPFQRTLLFQFRLANK